MCTTPVPSSVVTSSDRMTRNASPVPYFSVSARYGNSGSYRRPASSAPVSSPTMAAFSSSRS
jgi:hypothetical protein